MKRKILFIDRDGTLIKEPPDKQVDSMEKFALMPGVISALQRLQQAGYELVMVSNQDGLGTSSFPMACFTQVQSFLLDLFKGEGICFIEQRICPHFEEQNCRCRKPEVGLLLDYLTEQKMDSKNSYVIGDRETDMLLAKNIGISGILIGEKNGWQNITQTILNTSRTATIVKKTLETDVYLQVNLANPDTEISTGIAFFDHMLSQLAIHGGFGLKAIVKGDYTVDDHHTVEDTALALGQALQEALGDKRGINRYGFLLPMDEALAKIALDICGRAYFVFEGKFLREKIGELSTECVSHFFRSLSQTLGASLHISISGENTHHMIEAVFKGVGRTLRQAISKKGNFLPTTKGVL